MHDPDVDHIESQKLKDEENEMPYYSIITDVQEKFKKDFFFMIETGLSSFNPMFLAVKFPSRKNIFIIISRKNAMSSS